MIIYAAVIMGVQVLTLIYNIIRNETEDTLMVLVSIGLYLPLGGRIFGWW